MELLLDKLVEPARSATLELVNVCKALPDFDTIQIVYSNPAVDQWGWVILPPPEQPSWVLRKQVKGVTDLAIDCLKKPGTMCREGDGGKNVVVRVVELSPYHPRSRLAPAKVEEYEA